MRLTVRGVLFDMDGTLVDSNALVEQIWTDFCQRYSLDPQQVLAYSHGRITADTVNHFAPPEVDRTAEIKRLDDTELTAVDGIVEVPGAGHLLAQLPPESFAIVTSASINLMRVRMAAANVIVPSTLVCAGDCVNGKPAPDVYLRGAQLLALEPQDCVVFEDSRAGIASGLAAGIPVVVVGNLDDPVTDDLPRIPDYTNVSVTIDHDAEGLLITFDL